MTKKKMLQRIKELEEQSDKYVRMWDQAVFGRRSMEVELKLARGEKQKALERAIEAERKYAEQVALNLHLADKLSTREATTKGGESIE